MKPFRLWGAVAGLLAALALALPPPALAGSLLLMGIGQAAASAPPPVAPAVDVAHSTTKVATSGTTVVINKPTGSTTGDLLLFCGTFTVFDATPTNSLPGGWTLQASVAWDVTGAQYSYCASRVVDGSEGSTFTFDVTTSGDPIGGLGVLARITGAGAIDVTNTTKTTSGSTGSFPSVTTTGAARLVVGYGFQGGGGTPSGSQWNSAVPSGTTLIAKTNDSTFAYNGAVYFTQDTAGATGSKTVPTLALSTGAVWNGITVAISPP
jgi:hypothetical protein